MLKPDPYPKTKRIIIRILKDGLAEYGFSQYKSSTSFYRERGDSLDVLFFQKMRGAYFCVAYGVSPASILSEDKATLGVQKCQWLERQKNYNCRYHEYAEKNAKKALQAFIDKGLPWIENQHLEQST